MADDAMAGDAPGPLSPLAPGDLLTIADGALSVDIAPRAGGRIAQIRFDGIEQLTAHGEHGSEAAIAWGCYPMVPWCGRVRGGAFEFAGRRYALPRNLGAHAIHGLGFVLPWQVMVQSVRHVEMELPLPMDARWPFGGLAVQRVAIEARQLVLSLSVTAVERAMPAVLGWHPWFRKPDRMEFEPEAMYPRDGEGIAVEPPGDVPAGPWDDCFVNRRDVVLHRAGQRLVVSSQCRHWVIYDGTAHATCVEPQTGPPDAFNLGAAQVLQPGETLAMDCVLRWD
jgi:aldose 1-epimerase